MTGASSWVRLGAAGVVCLDGLLLGLTLISRWWVRDIVFIAMPSLLLLALLSTAVLGWRHRRAGVLGLVLLLPLLSGLPAWLNWRGQSPGNLCVVSANANYFGATSDPQAVHYEEAARLLLAQRADLLCTQDFTGDGKAPEKELRRQLSASGLGYFQELAASLDTFSRLPFLGWQGVRFEGTANGFSWVDLVWQERPLRLFNLHLQSYALAGARQPEAVLSHLRRGLEMRYQQVEAVAQAVIDSPHPVILCGDLNDVPGSYTYALLRSTELKDGFVEAGRGVAQTYKWPVPAMRIDYVMASPELRFTRYQHLSSPGFADHHWVRAELEWRR